MSLCCMRELLLQAEEENRAVGSFSIANMEMIMGAVKAAEETNTPIILQIAESRLGNTPLELIAPMMLAAAREAKVPVAVHFDHGATLPRIYRTIELGFTSVMFDGSRLPIEENIAVTKAIKEKWGEQGCVEAELGVLGKDENGNVTAASSYTDPDDAVRFVAEAKPDALAVAIGNAHGLYKGKPVLRLDILEEIHRRVDVPLVLHGGTGITPEDFRRCIRLGVRKINIATANFLAFVKGAKEYLRKGEEDYFAMDEALVDSVYENVKTHIEIFNNR